MRLRSKQLAQNGRGHIGSRTTPQTGCALEHAAQREDELLSCIAVCIRALCASFILAASAILLIAARQPASQEHDVEELAKNFLYASLALDPVSATLQGYHEHNGQNLDELWADYSPAGIERARDFFHHAIAEANRLSQAQLPLELQGDLDVIKLAAESQALDLDRIQPYRHNPTVYVEAIGNGLYSPFVLNYAPEAKRLAEITARIEKIPAFLETAKSNLVDSPEIRTQVAIEENQGNLDLIDHTIRAKIPADLKPRYDRASTTALAALRSFDDYLKTTLSRHSGDWRMDPQLYAEKFRVDLATGDTPQQALEGAEAEMQRIREDMYKQSVALYPKFFPGEKPSGGVNAVVSRVLDKVAQQHTTPDRYFDEAKRDLAATTQFVQDHHLLALPNGMQLEVIPTPVFMRGIYGVGGFSAAPALEPNLGSYYWITPFAPGMLPARVESKLREYNVYGLNILTIHEAMPGHFVQFEYSNEVQPPWRRYLRAVYSNNPYVEGWAVYATELMIDQGYLNTPGMRLTFGKQMLRVVANTILDVKMYTMGMTDQQAMDLMVNDTFQEKEEAQEKLQRAKLSACQLPSYFVGWRGWDRLRDAYRRSKGSAFQVSEFHERALREGSVPLPVLDKILLQSAPRHIERAISTKSMKSP